jgi:hypothetical protein
MLFREGIDGNETADCRLASILAAVADALNMAARHLYGGLPCCAQGNRFRLTRFSVG